MQTPGLKLVDQRQAARGTRRGWLVGAAALAVALLATVSGANRARQPMPVLDEARAITELALAQGIDAPSVTVRLRALRAELAQRPLDGRAHAEYGALLLGLARSTEETAAAVRYARRARQLSPVTVPVLRRSILVLARAGQRREATEETRRIFEFAPAEAADLLLRLETVLSPEELPAALADTPDAWLAWAAALRSAGRADEADLWITMGQRRWPDHVGLVRRTAESAVRSGDWKRAGAVLPESLPEQAGADAGAVAAYRARWHAETGRAAAARTDLERAEALGQGDTWVQVLIGEGWLALEDVERARRTWNRALFALPAGAVDARRDLLLRLARLEEAHGRPATALRHWETILRLERDHAEATAAVERLAGVAP